MSHRLKGKPKTTLDPFNFMGRRQHLTMIAHEVVSKLRIAYMMLEAAEGTDDHWAQIGGHLNMCIVFAQEKKRPDWLAKLEPACKPMESALRRNERVGGRWVLTKDEAPAVLAALNCMDMEVFPHITRPEYERIIATLHKQYIQEIQNDQK